MKSLDKAILKYQLGKNALRAVGMYYLVILAFFGGIAVLARIFGGDGVVNVNNTELNTMIFLFVYGLNILKQDLKFFSANGLTRKQLFRSVMMMSMVLPVLMVAIDVVLGFVFSKLFVFESISASFLRIYPNSQLWQHVVFVYINYVMLFVMGFFVSSVYYKLNPIGKIVISAGVPGFVFVGLPVLNSLVFQRKLLPALGDGFLFIMGIQPVSNILIGMISFLVMAGIGAACSFLLVRKAVIKF